MACFPCLLTLFLTFFFLPLSESFPETNSPNTLSLLLTIKASLDPQSLILTSWSSNATDPCDGSFEGVFCNQNGQVTNISLQGKGLSGQIPVEISHLRNLSGLYLHFNHLHGVVPRELGNLTQLTDLYLNVNKLTGHISPEIGYLPNLNVLQLCYNNFTGNIPSQLGLLKNLSVLALQSNQLTGAIPASLGDLSSLTRLDLSFNHLFGSIPLTLAGLTRLRILDIRYNSLSGNVPQGLKGLGEGFRYSNNTGLCGIGYSPLLVCSASGNNSKNAQPLGTDPTQSASKDITEPANLQQKRSEESSNFRAFALIGVLSLLVSVGLVGVITFTHYLGWKQKIGRAHASSNSERSTDDMIEVYRRNVSPLIDHSNGWSTLSKRQEVGTFSQEFLEGYIFNLEEVESATQYFSDANLLGKGSFSATYKGILRDGSMVAIKCISKISCKSDADEFLEGLKLLISLKHENILGLRGFCCSKDRGECFLIYDFAINGNLSQYLDVNEDKQKVLDWSTRKSIIRGIAKGIEYLHGSHNNKARLVHRSISAEKILIDKDCNPLLSDAGLHELLADDFVFTTLKCSAALGYLAPEYTSTGRLTEKSDVYAFGMIIFQILSGKSRITELNSHGAEIMRFEDFIDRNLEGNFKESEASRLGEVALLCTHELPDHRPQIGTLMLELEDVTANS